jgi:hypothetical protein
MLGRSESMAWTLAYPRLDLTALVHFDIVQPRNGILIVGMGKEVTRTLGMWAYCSSWKLNSEDEKEASKGRHVLQNFDLEDDYLYSLDRSLCIFDVIQADRIQLVADMEEDNNMEEMEGKEVEEMEGKEVEDMENTNIGTGSC